MAYVNVEEWEREQVGEWIRGLGDDVVHVADALVSGSVDGRRLLQLSPGALEALGVWQVGQQELLLEALEQLRLFQHELHRENLQLLALRLSCRARSLLSTLKPLLREGGKGTPLDRLPTHTLADIAYLLDAAKELLSWLHRPPFEGVELYHELERELMSESMSLAVQARRERFVEDPVQSVWSCSNTLASLARRLVEDWSDPLVLQPASLDVATLRRRRPNEDLGLLFLDHGRPGLHLVAAAQLQSPAHLCGKLHHGDEVVQVNYQTVVGWDAQKVGRLLEESGAEAILTLKRRPRHSPVFGQMYMRPFRLPSKQQRQHQHQPSSHQRAFVFWAPPPPLHLAPPTITVKASVPVVPPPAPQPCSITPPPAPAAATSGEEESGSEEEEEDVVEVGTEIAPQENTPPCPSVPSPPKVPHSRFYLPKPRPPVQRRATVTGASPTSSRPPLDLDHFWAQVVEQHRKSKQNLEGGGEGEAQLRRPQGSSSPVSPPPRPATCIGTRSDYSCTHSSSTRPSGIHPSGTHPSSIPLPGELVLGTSQSSTPSLPSTPTTPTSPTTPTTPKSPSGRKISTGERPRLDKSQSTPAYDMCQLDEGRRLAGQDQMSQCHVLSPLPSPTTHSPMFSCPSPPVTTFSCPAAQKYNNNTICQMTETSMKTALATKEKRGGTGGTREFEVTIAAEDNEEHQEGKKREEEERFEGWLFRCEKSSSLLSSGKVRWSRRWFVLRRHLLYSYKTLQAMSSDSTSARESVLHVAGLKVATAPEVQSQNNAFKLYHSGATFYFAAESQEERRAWMERLMNAAMLGGDQHHQSVPRTPEEDEGRNIRKASSSPSLQQPPPKRTGLHGRKNVPARSSSSSSSKGKNAAQHNKDGSLASGPSPPSLCASVDRKYFQLLSLARVSPERPVPTAQYRSYRRVTATSPPPPPLPAPAPTTVPVSIPVSSLPPPHQYSQHQSRPQAQIEPAMSSSPSDTYQDRSPEQRWLSSLRSTFGLKSATLYHPVRRTPTSASSSSSSSKMHMAFEMNLDDTNPPPPPPLAKLAPFKQLKQLLSPRPHRRPSAPPFTDPVFALPPAPSISTPAPAMGVAMIGKQRRTPPPPVMTVPDYPHLTYPPIFEPGTYSLRAPPITHMSSSSTAKRALSSDTQPRKV